MPRTEHGSATTRLPARMRRAALVVGVFALVAVTTGVTVTAIRDEAPAPAPEMVAMQASQSLPSQTLEEWASYADELAVIQVIEERELPPAKVETTGGYVPRDVTVRVERTLWRRSAAPDPAPATFSFTDLGWLERDGVRVPVGAAGGNRLEVGKRYLAPLVRVDSDWFPLAPNAQLLLDGDTVTDTVDMGRLTPAARRMTHLDVAAAAERLAATPPDPVAKRFADLPPRERFNAAAEAKE